MSQTQSIIVYRNPVEQAVWEGIMSNPGTLLYIIAMMVISVAVIVVFLGPVHNKIICRNCNFRERKQKSTTPVWCMSLLTIAAIGYCLSFLIN